MSKRMQAAVLVLALVLQSVAPSWGQQNPPCMHCEAHEAAKALVDSILKGETIPPRVGMSLAGMKEPVFWQHLKKELNSEQYENFRKSTATRCDLVPPEGQASRQLKADFAGLMARLQAEQDAKDAQSAALCALKLKAFTDAGQALERVKQSALDQVPFAGGPGGMPGGPGGMPGAPGGMPGAPGGMPGAPGGMPGAPDFFQLHITFAQAFRDLLTAGCQFKSGGADLLHFGLNFMDAAGRVAQTVDPQSEGAVLAGALLSAVGTLGAAVLSLFDSSKSDLEKATSSLAEQDARDAYSQQLCDFRKLAYYVDQYRPEPKRLEDVSRELLEVQGELAKNVKDLEDPALCVARPQTAEIESLISGIRDQLKEQSDDANRCQQALLTLDLGNREALVTVLAHEFNCQDSPAQETDRNVKAFCDHYRKLSVIEPTSCFDDTSLAKAVNIRFEGLSRVLEAVDGERVKRRNQDKSDILERRQRLEFEIAKAKLQIQAFEFEMSTAGEFSRQTHENRLKSLGSLMLGKKFTQALKGFEASIDEELKRARDELKDVKDKSHCARVETALLAFDSANKSWQKARDMCLLFTDPPVPPFRSLTMRGMHTESRAADRNEGECNEPSRKKNPYERSASDFKMAKEHQEKFCP